MSNFSYVTLRPVFGWAIGSKFDVYFPAISTEKKFTYTETSLTTGIPDKIAAALTSDSEITDKYIITSDAFSVKVTAREEGPDYNIGLVEVYGITPLLYEIFNASEVSVASVIHITTCHGDMTGAIYLNASGGNPPLFFNWTKAGDSNFSAGGSISRIQGLGAGLYSVAVSDSSGSTLVVINNIEVTQPEKLVVQAEVVDQDVFIQVTGGIAPYTYAWDDGPTIRDRTGLVEGDYRLTVTDSVGCTALALVIVGDDQFFFVKNPIALELDADDPETKDNLSFNVEVWIEDEYLSGDYAKVLEEALEQPADANGETVFDVSAVLDANENLKMHLPPYNENDILLGAGIFKRFYLKHAEKYGTPPVIQAFTQVTTNFIYNGGLSYEEFAEGNYFKSYFQRQRPFLTWQPTRKTVFDDQPEYLYYAVASDSVTEIRLQVTVHYDNGAESTYWATDKVKTGLQKYEVYCIPVGYHQLIYGSSAGNILWYEVQVFDQTLTAVSEVRRYDIEQGYYPNRRYFLYQNSLGGSDTVVCVGQASDRLRTKTTEAMKTLDHDYSIEDGEYLVVSKVGEQRLSLSTGYKSKEYIDSLKDFVLSKEVYLMANDRYLPVRISGNYKDDEANNLHLLDIAVELPNVSSYTPYFNKGRILPDTPNFSISVREASYLLERDVTVLVYVDIQRFFDFDEFVTLSIESGLPDDVSLVYMKPPTEGSVSSFTLRADDFAQSGTFEVRVRAVSSSYPNGYTDSFFINVVINPDYDAPVFTVAPTLQNIASRAYGLAGSINEDGFVYFYTLPVGSAEPTINENGGFEGNSILYSEQFAVSAGAWSFDFDEELLGQGEYGWPLTPATDYNVYVYARDIQGNFQTELVKLSVTTLSAPAFEVTVDEDDIVVEKGGLFTTNVNIIRSGGYSDDISIFLDRGVFGGQGIIIKVTPRDVSGVNTAELSINVTSGAPVISGVFNLEVLSEGTDETLLVPVNLSVVEEAVARVYASNDYVEGDYVE